MFKKFLTKTSLVVALGLAVVTSNVQATDLCTGTEQEPPMKYCPVYLEEDQTVIDFADFAGYDAVEVFQGNAYWYFENIPEDWTGEIDLAVTIGGPNASEIQKNKALEGRKYAVINFAHHGELPGEKAFVGMTGLDLEIGSELYIYYFNPTTGKLELANDGEKVEVFEDENGKGYIGFYIYHCSDYVAVTVDDTGAGINDAKNYKTGVQTVLFVAVPVMALAICGVIYSSRKIRK